MLSNKTLTRRNSIDIKLPWFLQKDSQHIYTTGSYISLDFETTNLEYGSALNLDNHIVLACWIVVTPEGETKKYKFGDEYEMQELLDDIKKVKFVLAHNAKFEAQWLKRCGVDLTEVLLYDTMLGQWVLDGNIKTEKNLDALALRYLGVGKKQGLVARWIQAGICPSKIPRKLLLPYCGLDVDLCTGLFKIQVKLLEERDQLHIVHTRNLTCSVLADIEFNGMQLDADAVLQEFKKTSAEKESALHKLTTMADGVNFNSPKQLGILLYETLGFEELRDRKGKPLRTPAGGRSTGADTLLQLKATTLDQTIFLETYRQFSKADSLLSKNLSFFQGVCEEKEGRFYGQFNQAITATHRLSSSGRPLLFSGEKKTKSTQFQNMPREYKRLFTASGDDYLVVEADGAQLEFRVAADLCRDSVARQEIIDEVDVHSFTAKAMTDAGEPTSRQDAKRMTFKPLFGGQSGTKAEKAYIKFFTEKYDSIAKEQKSWTYKVLNDKQLRTRYGMIYFYPNARNDNGYITETTSIYNFSIQGFATAEIIPIALVHLWHRVKHLRCRLLNTIHDSVVGDVHKDDVQEYKLACKEALTTDVFRFLSEVYKYDFVIPLGVGIKTARNWGTSKQEEIWNVYPDGESNFKIKE